MFFNLLFFNFFEEIKKVRLFLPYIFCLNYFEIKIDMWEIEAKRKLKASEGAHFFYSLIFLSATTIIENNYIDQTCN